MHGTGHTTFRRAASRAWCVNHAICVELRTNIVTIVILPQLLNGDIHWRSNRLIVGVPILPGESEVVGRYSSPTAPTDRSTDIGSCGCSRPPGIRGSAGRDEYGPYRGSCSPCSAQKSDAHPSQTPKKRRGYQSPIAFATHPNRSAWSSVLLYSKLKSL